MPHTYIHTMHTIDDDMAGDHDDGGHGVCFLLLCNNNNNNNNCGERIIRSADFTDTQWVNKYTNVVSMCHDKAHSRP